MGLMAESCVFKIVMSDYYDTEKGLESYFVHGLLLLGGVLLGGVLIYNLLH